MGKLLLPPGLLVCLSTLLVPTPGVAADLYKWTDAQGQVHYGDNPGKGAHRIHDDPVQTYSPPRQVLKLSPAPTKDPQAFAGYRTVAIANPQAQETIWDNEGALAVSARLEPELQMNLGHQLQFVLDGKPVGAPSTNTSATLSEIDRGTHALGAVVYDADGKPIAQAQAVEFSIKKVSRLQRTENLHGRR